MLKNLISISLCSILFTACATTNSDEIYNQNKQVNQAVIQSLGGPSLATAIGVSIAQPIAEFLFKDMLVKKAHGHLNSKDALLSSLQDPYFKYKNDNKELWVYFDVPVYDHESNMFFVLEGNKIIDFYTKLEDVPNGKNYIKDETYIDPLKKYREY